MSRRIRATWALLLWRYSGVSRRRIQANLSARGGRDLLAFSKSGGYRAGTARRHRA